MTGGWGGDAHRPDSRTSDRFGGSGMRHDSRPMSRPGSGMRHDSRPISRPSSGAGLRFGGGGVGGTSGDRFGSGGGNGGINGERYRPDSRTGGRWR
jgi:hypothetical protein